MKSILQAALLSLLPLCAISTLCSSCSHQISQGQEVVASSITVKNGRESYALFKEVDSQGMDYQMSYHNYPRDFNSATKTISLGTLSMAEMQPVFALIRQFEASSFTPVLLITKNGQPPVPFDQQLELLLHSNHYAYDGQSPRLREAYAELLKLMIDYKKKAMNRGVSNTSYAYPQ